MAFVERSEPCLGMGCKNAVRKSAAKVCTAFCAECRTDMTKMQQGYLAQLEKYNAATDRLARLMVAHNQYHGLSSHVDNLCRSRECKVFYMVRKAQRDQANIAETYTRVLEGFAMLGYGGDEYAARCAACNTGVKRDSLAVAC
eukprot:SAG31_NODE_2571_length_5459_cov_7.139925_3_plen_143_part_00